MAPRLDGDSDNGVVGPRCADAVHSERQLDTDRGATPWSRADFGELREPRRRLSILCRTALVAKVDTIARLQVSPSHPSATVYPSRPAPSADASGHASAEFRGERSNR
jgi:hypothetical protein